LKTNALLNLTDAAVVAIDASRHTLEMIAQMLNAFGVAKTVR
jgi:16S rRNA C967 or C1407 C5-methylase (RsmB/RsmF family)